MEHFHNIQTALTQWQSIRSLNVDQSDSSILKRSALQLSRQAQSATRRTPRKGAMSRSARATGRRAPRAAGSPEMSGEGLIRQCRPSRRPACASSEERQSSSGNEMTRKSSLRHVELTDPGNAVGRVRTHSIALLPEHQCRELRTKIVSVCRRVIHRTGR